MPMSWAQWLLLQYHLNLLFVSTGGTLSCGPTQPANSFHVACSLVDGGCIFPVGVSEVHCSMWPVYLENPRSPQQSQDSHPCFSFAWYNLEVCSSTLTTMEVQQCPGGLTARNVKSMFSFILKSFAV